MSLVGHNKCKATSSFVNLVLFCYKSVTEALGTMRGAALELAKQHKLVSLG